MKKFFYYLPFILHAVLYGALGLLAGFNSLQPTVYILLLLFALSGYFMMKKASWACLLGMIPAIYFIYLSTQDNGQIINIELPAGIIIIIYYVICGLTVYFGNRKVLSK